jgi:hypothetical protein
MPVIRCQCREKSLSLRRSTIHAATPFYVCRPAAKIRFAAPQRGPNPTLSYDRGQLDRSSNLLLQTMPGGPAMNVVVLWGGGLGDALVLRPLLEACCERGISPLLVSTASHIPGLAGSLGQGVRSLILPRQPLEALAALRRLEPIDLLYLSPYSPWKTRLLARLAGARRVWSNSPRSRQFIGDVICADVTALKLAGRPPRAYGSLPVFRPDGAAAPSMPGAVLIHPGSRAKWRTTRWPAERWIELLQALRRSVDRPMVAVGTAGERELLEQLCRSVPGLGAYSDLSLAQLEGCIAQAALVICSNSGIMHLALAHRRPTVVVTGSSARFWRAPFPEVRNIGSGRCELACNRPRCPVPGYDARCIKELDSATVLAAVQSVLGI